MAAATDVLAFPAESLASMDSSGDVKIFSHSAEELENTLLPPINLHDRKEITPQAPRWAFSSSRHTLDSASAESENELSSLDSLTESPDATTISTSSHRSSLSSLSGVVRKGQGASRQWAKSPKQDQRPKYSPVVLPLSTARKSQYHELRDQLVKFSARQGPAKANYLRLSLLSFLRKRNEVCIQSTADQDLPIKVLSAWYDQLLKDLNANQRQVSGSDRNAYYEAVSGLMDRVEWLDHQHEPIYQSLLRRTLTHALLKSSVPPHLPIAQAAFMGKVMAYSFFYVPEVAEYLLSCLNIQRETVKRLTSLDSKTATASSAAAAAAASLTVRLSGVPPHLQRLVGSTVPPAKMTAPEWLSSVPQQGWVRHWQVESLLFTSFFKHFCSLQTQFFPIINPLGVGSGENEDTEAAEVLVLSAPGMLLVLSAIVDNLDTVVRQFNRVLGTRNGNPYARRPTSTMGSASAMSRIRIDQIKCFTAFREILHSDEATVQYFTPFCQAFDRAIRATVIRTEVYDMDSCVTVCDLAEEWMSSVFLVPSPKSEQYILANHYRILDWQLWLLVAQRMLKSDNCHTEIRALSFLFNIWPHIPGYCRGQGNESSFLRTATHWLLSPDVFLQLFCHWSPLVRSYYHRILCFRVASVGVKAESWFLDVDSAEYYAESRDLLAQRLSALHAWCSDLMKVTHMIPSISPSLPVPRLRVAIRPNAALQSTMHRMESGLNRLHPFDIFDNAAYWLPEPHYVETVGLKRQSSVSSRASTQTSATGMSTASGISTRSMATISSELSDLSFASNDSEQSNISVASQSSRSSRLSLTALASILGATSRAPTTMEEPEDNAEDGGRQLHDGSGANTVAGTEESSVATILKRRWFSLKGLLAGKNSNKENSSDSALIAETATAINSASSAVEGVNTEQQSPVKLRLSKHERQIKNAERKRALKISRKREQHEAAQAAVPLPPQLAEQRPEILRSPHRFVLVPVNGAPSADSGKTFSPRLPFSPTELIEAPGDAISLRALGTDLAVWNYGFRSLAEWNVTVNMFEGFATQEHDHANGNIEMLQIPFLVAEIPWRALA